MRPWLAPAILNLLVVCLLFVIGQVAITVAIASNSASRTPPTTSATVVPASTRVADAAQDATGKVWAILVADQGDGAQVDASRLYSWTGAGWSAESVPSGVHGAPLRLVSSSTGAVICAWGSESSGYTLTGQRGAFARIVGSCKPMQLSLMVADADNVWLVSALGEIDRIDARVGQSGPAKVAYRVKPNDYFPGFQSQPDGSPVSYGRWDGFVDLHGRVWFYTSALRSADNEARLRGVIEWTGANMVAHPTLTGFPDKPIDSISVMNEMHLFVGCHNGGLYTLDTGTMSVGAEDKSIRDTQCVVHLGTDMYLVTGLGSAFPTQGMPPGKAGYVYRWDGNSWQDIIAGIDAPNFYRLKTSRSAVVTDAGMWMGTNGNYAWLIPPGGVDPKHLDFRYDFALPTVDRIFHVAPSLGGVLAIAIYDNDNRVSSTVAHLEKFASSQPAKSLPVFSALKGIVQGADKHVWAVLAASPPGQDANIVPSATLFEWDTQAWNAHPASDGVDFAQLSNIMIDSSGRIWLQCWRSADPAKSSVFLFSPSTHSWQDYVDYDSALIAVGKEVAGNRQQPPLTVTDDSDKAPVFAPDGRVVYLDANNTPIHYYDGTKWQTWSRPQITGYPKDNFVFDGPPYFDKDGILCANVNAAPGNRPRLGKPVTSVTDEGQRTTFRYNPADGSWTEGAYQAGPDDMWLRFATFNKLLNDHPVGLGTHDDGSLARDPSGDIWTTSKGILFRLDGGAMKAVVPSDDVSPFIDGRRVYRVVLDGVKTAFVDTWVGSHEEWVMVPVPETGGQTSLSTESH